MPNSEPLTYNDAISRGEVQPIILFGAPRSGTQMYRDMICSHPDVATWPYNEMTYMWRYGNRNHPTDEIPVEKLTRKSARYIRNSFIKLSEKTGSPMVLDKTCHNCLRPEYVQAVLPEAKYIYLVRHAMDVVPSTIKRSEHPPPAQEFTRIKSMPLADVGYYVARAAWNHGGLLRPGNSQARIWGPRFTGMEELAATRPMPEVYAYQWLRHIELTDRFLNDPAFDAPLLRVRYEEITKHPREAFEEVYGFLGISVPEAVVEEWIGKVNYREPGSGAGSLGEHEAAVEAIVAEKNGEHGYQSTSA
ncbi:MAG: sulfotransferase [Actinomycetota bacterium]